VQIYRIFWNHIFVQVKYDILKKTEIIKAENWGKCEE
jgi:hypothetical protein